jgi:hypothetical protein
MRTLSRPIVILAGVWFAVSVGAQEPASSSTIIDQAKSQAGSQRAIFVIFHASW